MSRVDENAELGRVIAEGAESGLMSDKLAELLYIQDIGKSLAVIADHIQPTKPTASWKKFDDDYIKCSKCERIVKFYHYNYRYCPHCGARMTESEEEI